MWIKRTIGYIGGLGPHFLALFASSVFLCLMFGPILRSPNSYFFGTHSDGLKNYFTPMYHAAYDGDLFRFTGLNYPYGDHIFYADAQPLLVWAIRLLSVYWPDASHYTLAIMNLCLLLSLPLGTLTLFAILRRLSLPVSYGLVMAAGIIFFSPQVWRIGGHYGLSYTLAIPLVWLLFIRFTEAPSLRRSILVPLVITAWSGLHFYYLALCALLIIALWIAHLWRKGQLGSLPRLRLATHFLLQTAAAPLILMAFIRLTDPVFGERPIPDAWAVYTASLHALLFPTYRPYFGNSLFQLRSPEGIAYLTPLGWVTAAVLVLRLWWNFNWRSIRTLRWFGPDLLRDSVPASFVLLGIALGAPVLVVDVLPAFAAPLQQFRTLGRFVWPFYYIFMVYGAYVLYVLYRRLRQSSRLATPVFLLLVGVFAIEVINFTNFMSKHISNRIAELDSTDASPLVQLLADVEPGRYQAILPIPFYHLGSETYFDYLGNDLSMRNSMVASLRSGLPIVGCFLNRTSLVQTRKTLGFIRNDQLREEFLKDLPNQKPLLVILSGSPLTEAEAQIVQSAAVLGKAEGVSLYEFQLTDCENSSGR